jgi:phosphatidylglycerophosphatase A
MPRRKNWWATVATLGPVGYFVAPGTLATVITLPFVYMLNAAQLNYQSYIALVFALFIASLLIVKQALVCFDQNEDPSEIVLDEIIGCLLTFWMIPVSTQSILVGFLLFRAFDIIKFGWIKRAESLADAWGVIGDDILAGLLANFILRLLYLT